MPSLRGKRPPGRVIPTFRYDRQGALGALWPKRRDVAFVPKAPGQEEAFAEIIPALMATPPVAFASTPDAMALAGRARSAGFALELWQVDSAWFWVLREQDDVRSGAGSYIFRASIDEEEPRREHEPVRQDRAPGSAPLVILQAPHSYFDLHTGDIAAAIFFGQAKSRVRIDALMVNSLHRYQQTAERRSKEASNPADVCHNPDHPFQHATALAAKAAGSRPAVFVQLHGFGERDREDEEDRGEQGDEDDQERAGEQPVEYPAIIVSSGRKAGSSPLGMAVALALGNAFGRQEVRRYPEEIRFLGGTTNVQGRLLRKRKRTEFLHLEMSLALRKRLLATPGELEAFAEAVLGRE